ncbi:hypothetical protein QF035_002394 [Streptomyces umbrinus]|uniref:Uncharacterized protein n=1 Tax=Streptomyces umbrinus TaxID=67370 RepID=A0ABU0SMM9_9ACTN|nr:hypothetical protein [Streptomyces umbrinus]MDQ1024812.1 hypothetical protein [Streptomyces umbrinus]
MKVRQVTAPHVEPDTVAVVAEAFLPLLHWRGVPVLRRKPQELTMLERFVLEMGLSLGAVEPADFAEVTSLPATVLAGAAWRLVADGALVPQGAGYGVRPERAAATLERQAVSRLVNSTADFALLPRTGDVLAVAGGGGGWLRDLDQKLIAGDRAPLPASLVEVHRAAYLAQRVQNGTVAGLGAEVVDVPVPEDDVPLVTGAGQNRAPVLCPAYRCRARVRRTASGDHHVEAVVLGRPRRGAQGDEDATVEIEADLSGADALVNGWLELTGALEFQHVQQAAWRTLGPPSTGHGRPPLNSVSRRGPLEWDMHVSGPTANALCAHGRSLTEAMGLAVVGEEAVVELACWFVPADEEARGLFAREKLVARLLSSRTPDDEFGLACREAADQNPTAVAVLSPQAVRERIWQLGHYQLVYALREREDFAHD